MNKQSLLSIVCAGLLLGVGALVATEAEAAKARSAKSIECSKQADAKGLHGKPRKAFRSKCLRSKAA
jgi:hypothetical protein